MLAEILRTAFARTHERLGFVLLDIIWKAIWLICSVAAVVFAAAWFGSQLQDLAWDDTGRRAVNALIAAAAGRELWQAMRREVLLTLLLLASASVIGWFVLEAFVRSRLMRKLENRGASRFSTYLIARIMKTAVLTTAGLILLLVGVRGAPILAAILFVTFAFCLTLIETLVRADALDLLGTDLIRVSALIGILMSFEMMIAASFVVILAAGFLNVAWLGEALAMLGATGVSIVFLTVIHSYLLLVRLLAVNQLSGCESSPTGAINLMRRNVVAV